MTDLPTIGDHRWEGYNPNDLVEVVKQVKSGPGAAAMNPAMDALKAASQVVADMDATLRKRGPASPAETPAAGNQMP